MAADMRARCLIVPGLDNSGPEHWQTLWEQRRDDCRRIDLGCWSDPDPAIWIARLDEAVARDDAPALLVAHSLGCLAIAHWARLGNSRNVAGAMLVAPPDVDRPGVVEKIRRFAPAPRSALPFPSLLVASRNDPYADFSVLEALAADWGSRLIDAGHAGHINAASRIGDWPDGERLLDAMLSRTKAPISEGTFARH